MSSLFSSTEECINEFTTMAESLYARKISHLTHQECFYALASLIAQKAKTQQAAILAHHDAHKVKDVYYFSLEFLIGPLLDNYLLNFGCRDVVKESCEKLGLNLDELVSLEVDPGLGNGGLGRLAACFLDSAAACGIRMHGMGMRYHYGLFRQVIEGGRQVEHMDNWLERGFPWERKRTSDAVLVPFGGHVERHDKDGRFWFTQEDAAYVKAVPYDVPIVGFGGETINNLRLWSAQPAEQNFNLAAFNAGNYAEAMRFRDDVEAISQILYPNDSGEHGRLLRLKQEYLFVCAGIHSILDTFEKEHGSAWDSLPQYVAIHTNDTHPALCGPELMRILVDEKDVEFSDAFEIARACVSYTNHTVMPEALEYWPISVFRQLLPRTYMIIDEMDKRFHELINEKCANRQDLLAKTAMLWDDKVRMACVSMVFSHSVNGVSELHTKILERETLNGFYELWPEKFTNKTNGISHRRFLANANPSYAALISDAIGTGWLQDARELEKLSAFEHDAAFLEGFAQSKRINKARLSTYIEHVCGVKIDPSMIFDVHVKRFHAYKRQLLSVFKILDIYARLKHHTGLHIEPTAFIFSGKAAQSYTYAKEVIRLINSVADVVNNDPEVSDLIKVAFVPNFAVSNAQYIYPACDISEQISWAGSEASGTSNMKLMMNGAHTLGTRDGANIEIAQLVGEDAIQLFGLNAKEVENLRASGSYWAWDRYNRDRLRLGRIIDSLTDGSLAHLSGNFESIKDELFTNNDHDLVLADFYSYVEAWKTLTEHYTDAHAWNSEAVHNTAQSGYFSSDRTIREYACDIWHIGS